MNEPGERSARRAHPLLPELYSVFLVSELSNSVAPGHGGAGADDRAYLAFFFFSSLAAFFSFMVFSGFFLSLFFESRPLLITTPWWGMRARVRHPVSKDYAKSP